MTIKNKIKEALTLCILQIFLYGILCINYRAVALGDYHEAAISDMLIACMQFFVIKKLANSTEAMHQFIGYVIGSVIGSYVGIYLSFMINA